MDADAFMVCLHCPRPEPQVRGPQRLELRDEVVGVVIAMAQALHPAILVVPHDVGFILGDDPADARAGHQFRIEEVPEALDDRPLSWRRAIAQPRPGGAHELAHPFRGRRGDDRRVIGAE
jgi:hypothetical protein